MKSLILTLITICALSNSGISQFSGNIETTVNGIKHPSSIGVGGSLQYLFYYSKKSLPGINAGVLYEVNRGFESGAFSFPINLQFRQYIVGAHGCSGGGYIEGNAGIKISKQKNELKANRSASIFPQGSLGIGYRLPMSYDFNVRIGSTLINGTSNPFLGFKLGYTF